MLKFLNHNESSLEPDKHVVPYPNCHRSSTHHLQDKDGFSIRLDSDNQSSAETSIIKTTNGSILQPQYSSIPNAHDVSATIDLFGSTFKRVRGRPITKSRSHGKVTTAAATLINHSHVIYHQQG